MNRAQRRAAVHTKDGQIRAVLAFLYLSPEERTAKAKAGTAPLNFAMKLAAAERRGFVRATPVGFEITPEGAAFLGEKNHG